MSLVTAAGSSSSMHESQFSVRGGPGSIHANLEELERASAWLGSNGDDALFLGAKAGACGGLLSAAVSSSSRVQAVMAQAAELSGGLLAFGAEALTLQGSVFIAANSYRFAEEKTMEAFDRLVALPTVVMVLVDAKRDKSLRVHEAERVFNLLPETAAVAINGLNAIAPGAGTGINLAFTSDAYSRRDPGRHGPLSSAERLYPMALGILSVGGVVQTGPIRIVGSSEARSHHLDGGLEGLLELQEHTEEHHAGTAAIQVTQITPDAEDATERVFVVNIPGTQSDGATVDGWSTNPFDGGGILEAGALDSQHLTPAVAQALKQSGAQPGDTVITGGYSQGGMHAVRLINDPRLAEYNQAGVLTVASPVGDMDIADSVEALHIEDDRDVVAAGDGKPNPETSHRTTLVVGQAADELETEEALLSNHDYSNYRTQVSQLKGTEAEQQLSPALDQFRHLTAGDAVSRTFTLERTPNGPVTHPLDRLGSWWASSGEVSPSGSQPPSLVPEHLKHRFVPDTTVVIPSP